MLKTPTISVICDECGNSWTVLLSPGDKPETWVEGDMAMRMNCAGWKINARGKHLCADCVRKQNKAA